MTMDESLTELEARLRKSGEYEKADRVARLHEVLVDVAIGDLPVPSDY